MLTAPSSRKQSTVENRSTMHLSTAGLPAADEDESWRYGIIAVSLTYFNLKILF